MELVKKAGALGAAVALAFGMSVLVAAPQANAVSCPDNGWSILDGRVGQYFAGNGINIRTGPSTVCTSIGQGQASHTVQLDCYKSGEGGTWSHLFDFTTSRGGWVKDSLLVGNGANRHC